MFSVISKSYYTLPMLHVSSAPQWPAIDGKLFSINNDREHSKASLYRGPKPTVL